MAAALATAASVTAATEKLPAPLAYEPSSYESAREFTPLAKPWAAADLRREVERRAAREKQRRELNVSYYRIGFTLAFPLPLERRPSTADLPAGIPAIKYPWLIWLSWELEERWRILHAAWRESGDNEAGALLQRELAALATWESFLENNNQAGLVTAHLAGCLALALADSRGWDSGRLTKARHAAGALLDRDIKPWLAKTLPSGTKLTPAKIPNIPLITLARAAQLARVLQHPLHDALESRTAEVMHAWCRFRMGPENHTEGTAYDGYLFDSVTEWLAGSPQRAEFLRQESAALRSLADQWIDLTLPGRVDLHVPLGDVEAEMPFWSTALARLAGWYEWRDAGWLLSRYTPARFPAAALVTLQDGAGFFSQNFAAPRVAVRELRNAAALRTGWDSGDVAAVVSLSRNGMGHIQADAGQVVLAWHGRSWITDPGYQQYKAGLERDYTLGLRAHNAPTINGAAQTTRAAQLLELFGDRDGGQRVSVDLTKGFVGLPSEASIVRSVWLKPGAQPTVVVRDAFRGLTSAVEIGTSWLGGAHLAWAFVDGWARLSDGERALWIGTTAGPLKADRLEKVDGSRGPLTLGHRATLADGSGETWWAFVCSSAADWRPPLVELNATSFRLEIRGAVPVVSEIAR